MKKQEAIEFKKYVNLLREKGYTIREICSMTGKKSTSTIQHHLKNKGKLIFIPNSKCPNCNYDFSA